MPAMPEGVEEGMLKGLYRFTAGARGRSSTVRRFCGSGSDPAEALKAQEILAEKYGVSADVWSATSYKNLRHEALAAERWNMLHPGAKPRRKSHLETVLESEDGPFVAVSDYMRIVPDQIAKWVPGGLLTLGTDGFGRSDTREDLRRFFEIDPPHIVVAVLSRLAALGEIKPATVKKAMADLGVDPEQEFSLNR